MTSEHSSSGASSGEPLPEKSATLTGDSSTEATPLLPSSSTNKAPEKIRRDTDWVNVLFFIYLHLAALYGLVLVLRDAQWSTSLLALILTLVVPFGVTMGAHRLWGHRCYKANLPLRIVLIVLQTMAGQVLQLVGDKRDTGSVYDWVLEHRLHHKLRGTDLDPFDLKRGFMFAHLSSRLVKSHPRLEEELKAVDMSDLEDDLVVMLQKRFYWILMPILCLLLPINAPVEYWGESLLVSTCVVGFLRCTLVLNVAWLVNSGPLLWGLQPGENEADSNLVFVLRKSRWPDYHYLLPWDYRTSEFGGYGGDKTARLIEQFERLGWASDLRTCSEEVMKTSLNLAMDRNLPLRTAIEETLSTTSKTHLE